MRVLHLYANYKWTGPAELALLLARRVSDLGVASVVAIPGWRHPGGEPAFERRAAELGLDTLEGLELRRHFNLGALLRDAEVVARWMDEGRFDLVHCHQQGDHILAAVARSLAARPRPILRSLWEGLPLTNPRSRLAFTRTDAVLMPFSSFRDRCAAAVGLPSSRVMGHEPPLDPSVVLPAGERPRARAALRDDLGLDPEAELVGITARIQPSRRWDLCWEVVERVAALRPAFHLAVLGRADEGVFTELCEAPLRELGLTERVHFLGYRRGDAYRAALHAFDAFVYLVAGSDPSARALREAMLAEIPVVAVRGGRLAEIVDAGRSGVLTTADPTALACAIHDLLGDPDRARALGARAGEEARRRWLGSETTRAVLALYAELAGAPAES